VDSKEYYTAKIDAELTGLVTARILRERRSATGALQPATIRTVVFSTGRGSTGRGSTGLGSTGMGGATMFVHDAM
jgi:hypothetical protein